MQNNLPIAVFNGVVCTSNGLFKVSDISVEEARKMVNENDVISAVGHESTAEIITELLGVEIPMNRIQFHQAPGQLAIVFKLNVRPQEGYILNRQEITDVGYSFKLLQRLE